MPASSKMFGRFLMSLANKEVNMNTDVFKVMLVTSAWTPDQDTMQYKSAVTNEASGTGYTAGGATLSSQSVTYDAASNTLKFDASDVSWNNSTIAARYAVVYNSSPGSDATRNLVAYTDYGETVSTTNGSFQAIWNTGGIITIAAAA